MITKEIICKMYHFTPITKFDELRLDVAVLIANNSKSDGKWGQIAELLSATPKSRKMKISAQHRVDIFIKKQTSNGNISVECKSNGGGLESVTSKYMILWLISPKDLYARKPRMVKTETYFQFLQESNLIHEQKPSKGRGAGWCAKYKSPKYAEWFETLPEYDRTVRIDLDLIP